VDFVELGDRLRHWAALELLPGADVVGLAPMPGNAGLSFGFDVVDEARELRRSLVIRFAPPGVRRSGNTDVLRQVPLLAALQRNRIPVAPVVWSTANPVWFGTDAIVQERLSAEPLSLWGPAAGTREVAPYLHRAVETLAALHALDWRQALGDWEAPRSIADELAHWDRLLDRHPDPAWARAGRELAGALSGVDPGSHRIGVFHGDYHTNNILFDDGGSVAAVIDWEIAGIGPTGLDLGWLALMTDPSCWHPDQRGRMRVVAEPGRLQDWYASASGLPVAHPDWYRALACYRFGAIAGFNVRLHRTGRRPDPFYEDIATSVPVLFERGRELVGR
jgi:aminoglycoside phosphotransferase (APT) family kinase protein